MPRLLLAIGFIAGCTPKLTPPPAAPVPPAIARPAPLLPFDRPLPLPATSRQDQLAVQADGRLDAATRQSHVALVVPEGAVQIAGCPGGNGSARCLGDVRVGLSAALLAAGFELHDAGAVLLPALGIVSSGEVAWAAREQLQEAGHGKAAAAPSAPEVSVTVNASTTGEAGASEVATGVVLDDATSMWAHELGTVDELGRQLALRVFFVDVQQMDLPAPTAMELSPTQLVAFDRLAEDWNIDRDRWVASRNQATEEHIRWGDAWNAYEEEHGEWRRAYRSSIAAFDVPSQPVPRPSLVRLPDAPPRASRDTVLQLLAAHRGILRRVVGTLGVELVDMRTGRVLWVARASGEVAAGPGVEIELIQLLLGTALTEKRG